MSAVTVGGAGITVVASATTVAVLPNTGQLGIMSVLSQISLVIGGVVLTTTIARAIAKRSYQK